MTMLNEAGLKAAVRAAQETVFGNGVPVWEDDFPPIRAAISAYLATVQGEQKPVAWRVLVNENGKRMYHYTECLPFDPLVGSGVKVLREPEALYPHPVDRDSVLESAATLDELVEKAMKAFGMVANGLTSEAYDLDLAAADAEDRPSVDISRDAIRAAIRALKGDRDGVEAGDWRTMETAPKDGTRILAILHRETCKDMDGIRREAFSEVREIWWHPYQQFGMSLPWHAGDPFDSHDSRIGDCHMGEAVPVLWLPRGHLPTPPASALKGGA